MEPKAEVKTTCKAFYKGDANPVVLDVLQVYHSMPDPQLERVVYNGGYFKKKKYLRMEMERTGAWR